MTATMKKRIIIALSAMVMLFAGLFAFSACTLADNKQELKVTFMVQDDNGVWGEYTTVEVVDNAVEVPTAPTKQYYDFANWYAAEDFSGSVFTGKDVTASVSVYAKYMPVEVDVVINGASAGTQNLVDVVNGTYDPGEGLEFDGWYTNASCSEESKWNGTAVVQTLYAKSVAVVTFNNGYEDVYTVKVTPGTTYADPSTATTTTEEGTVTVEEASIRKNYMSKYDISYVDSEGNAFDFTKAITKNTEITVKWRSPFFMYQKNETTGNLIMTMYGNDYYDDTLTATEANAMFNTTAGSTVPVMSVLSTITFDNDGDGVAETYTVEGIRLEADLLKGAEIKKLIIGEGIESIQGINGESTSSVEVIVLPSSLKVIQNCFNNLSSLTGIKIPEGVEVIIGSFWANTYAYHNGYAQYNKGEAYGFDIAIPESVKNLSMVPSNLTFTHTKDTAQNGDFYKDGNYIYQKDFRTGHEGDLVLIADFTEGETVNVPEGVKGIQVGTYFNRTITNLNIPSTFTYVRYNENLSDYSYQTQYSTKTALWDSQYTSDPRSNIAPYGYCIFNGLYDVSFVKFDLTELPEGLSAYAVVGDTSGMGYAAYESNVATNTAPYTDVNFEDKIICVAESDTPKVKVDYSNTFTGESYSVTLTKSKNDTLTYAELLTAIDTANAASGTTTALATAYENNNLVVSSLTQFGAAYSLDTALTANVYLKLVATYSVEGGYVATANADGTTATITGYDSATAYSTAVGKIVCIPSEVTISGTKYTVTAIGANAFANNSEVFGVIVPSTVTAIGEKAFYNSASIEVIDISACKLQTIGASAFAGTSITEITLALSDLTSVGEYAFNIDTLKEFVPVAAEAERSMLTKADLKDGEFFFEYMTIAENWSETKTIAFGLYKYVEKSTDSGTGVTTWDVQFVASAAAFNKDCISNVNINVGDVSDTNNLIRYEVMAGAYYKLTSTASAKITVNLYYVKKLHANAFTDCEQFGSRKLKCSKTYVWSDVSASKTISELITACSGLFDDGWFNGATQDWFSTTKINKC